LINFAAARPALLETVRRLAAADPFGFADIEEVKAELSKRLGIAKDQIGALILHCRSDFNWQSTPVGKLRLL
jgi:hypothetical protein